jgi:hypothetical protein
MNPDTVVIASVESTGADLSPVVYWGTYDAKEPVFLQRC